MIEDMSTQHIVPPNLKPHMHPWKARVIVTLFMLILSFGGLLVTDLWPNRALIYWSVMIPIFAGLCLWLSWYLRKKEKRISWVSFGQELLHWAGLVGSVFLFSIYVEQNIMNRMQAAFGVLTLLSLGTFLSGVYIEFSFLVIGIVLGVFAFGAALLQTYLYTVMLPIACFAALLIIVISYTKGHSKNEDDSRGGRI